MRNNLKALPPADLLRECFKYDPETGEIVRIKKTHRNQRVGESVGYISARGYKYMKVNGRGLLFHRVAWKLVTGEDPPQEIDHVNKDRLDNRWCNLRAATPEQNLANRPLKGECLPGVKRHGSRFQARITINGTRRTIGTFNTEEEAHAAYVAEHVGAHGKFSVFARAKPSS